MKTQCKSGGKKKMGRTGPKIKHTGIEAKKVKRLLRKGSRKAKCALGKENIDSQVSLAAAPPTPQRVNSVSRCF